MKNSLFYLLALLCIQSSFGQASLTPDSALARLKNNYPQEKVFVQTDKAYYCMLGASDRNTGGNRYATILITRTGTDKKAQIAWISF